MKTKLEYLTKRLNKSETEIQKISLNITAYLFAEMDKNREVVTCNRGGGNNKVLELDKFNFKAMRKAERIE